jgi:uncharacterized membrane protein
MSLVWLLLLFIYWFTHWHTCVPVLYQSLNGNNASEDLGGGIKGHLLSAPTTMFQVFVHSSIGIFLSLFIFNGHALNNVNKFVFIICCISLSPLCIWDNKLMSQLKNHVIYQSIKAQEFDRWRVFDDQNYFS